MKTMRQTRDQKLRLSNASGKMRRAALAAGVVLPDGVSLGVTLLLGALLDGPMEMAVARGDEGRAVKTKTPHAGMGLAIQKGLAVFVPGVKRYELTAMGRELVRVMRARGVMAHARALYEWVMTGAREPVFVAKGTLNIEHGTLNIECGEVAA